MKIVSSKPIVVRSRSEKKVDKLVIDKDKIEEKKSGSHKSSCGLLVQLLLQSKFTDSEIIKKVLEEYPDRTEKQIQICLCSKRCDINKGEERYKKLHEQAGKILFPLIRNENGELVNKEKTVGTPKKVKKIKPKLELLLNDDTDDDTVTLYRMGDFYEMFNEDAKIASTVLGLTLTSRNHGGNDKTPLAGFPHHALDRYANKLVHAGYKIAICEQMEDPKTAKGLVKRDVIEIISAGTATEENYVNKD